ncbi:hypothetical protein M2163_001279 [Streptomyces sp. SAI-135]|uniref:hypothetical protein n=1 Tax=unclassified Streptomyces TaxID=2593676 RepID=UPI0024745C15|nr:MULTISPECIES: hypothetical protein [unclassified Streptomyces]MDH6521730.1 hypothetical protein [Streptomyces sp. SAI-090]MDH6614171.1 hypothetical protein [Streptomyces sp. SAI-135]
MRNTDPFVWFHEHSDAVFRWLGIAGLALLLYLLLRWWAMRWGGWRAAWARMRREVAVTAHAFAQPLRAWLGHRRALRLLVRRLRDQATWRDAERALAAARTAVAPARPYAALVGARTVTVLLAERGEPAPWTVNRAELPTVTPEAADVRPIVVAVGTADHQGEQHCAFLDLAVGPPVLSVTGDDRATRALLQTLAAQLDARLPGPLVVVAAGVHRDHPGEPVREAYRAARETPPRLGIAPVLVAAELPDPLPPELADPPGDSPALRVLVLGPGRGYVRTLLTDRHGRVAVTGTPLLARCATLGRAVARVLPTIPPVLPPAPSAEAAPGLAGTDLFEEGEEPARVFRTGPPRPAHATTATDPAAATAPAARALQTTEPGSTANRSAP